MSYAYTYIPFICVTFFPLFLFLIWNPIRHYWLAERFNYISLNESQDGLVGEKPRCDLCLAQRYYNSINCILYNIYDTWSEKIKLFRTLMREIMIIDNIMWVEHEANEWASGRCMKWHKAINNGKIIELIPIYFPINFQLVYRRTGLKL